MKENASIKALREAIDRSRYMVFFGGAGVSTESGIPDFRTPSGLYNQPGAYPPETILSHSFFEKHPEIFFDFYRKKMIHPAAKPNAAHIKLAQWERAGRSRAVAIAESRRAAPGGREAGRCWNCTAPSIAITAYAAAGRIPWRIYWQARGFPAAPAGGLSSRMWCCMRNRWTRRCWTGPCAISDRRICFSSGGPH